MYRPKESVTELKSKFEIKPRKQSDWSIRFECWNYNFQTQGLLDRALIGTALFDLSTL